MSDTITPKERAYLRKVASNASALPWKVEGCYSSNTNVRAIRADGVGFAVTHLSAMRDNWAEDAEYIVAACNIATRLLDALESAEARAEHNNARVETMRNRLMEQVDYTKTILSRAEKTEAENARLTKMVDWMATQLACIQSAYDIDQKTRDWSTARWAEAARRAVAAGEGE